MITDYVQKSLPGFSISVHSQSTADGATNRHSYARRRRTVSVRLVLELVLYPDHFFLADFRYFVLKLTTVRRASVTIQLSLSDQLLALHLDGAFESSSHRLNDFRCVAVADDHPRTCVEIVDLPAGFNTLQVFLVLSANVGL
jgi:hypothetical protein